MPAGPATGGSLYSIERHWLPRWSAHHFTTCPRISPPRLAAVWTLTYQRPPIRSAALASSSGARPVAGLVGLLPLSSAPPAFAPGAAGPWKWAAVAAPARLSNVTLHVI